MFEEFLSWRDKKSEGRLGLILLGEPSPLTFALEEFSQDHPQLHDASGHICNSANLEVIQKDVHPSHLDQADIAYLKAKGVFTPPSERTLDDLVAVYLTRFHPLYSIVNKVELEKVHKEHKLPWTLLHAVCFIGATFCEPYKLHSAGFQSRSDARCHFYQKAKLLFDTSYETNKIILLQVAIMLSFRGPQMQSYWNPCSWIGFGVTFAISLGLHRSTASSNAPGGDTGLLRRLWWTLVVRDTYCAVLLGRPFRIDLPHSDAEMLTPDDFVYESHDEAFYQIQMARLAPIMRNIASKAITLVTKARLSYLPHEAFPGFFVAGIVHYRQTQNSSPVVTQMARASLDNCRVILNEVKEFWEPGEWAMEIFDFLNMRHQNNSLNGASPRQSEVNATTLQNDMPADLEGDAQEDSSLMNNYLFGPNWDTVMQGGACR